MPRSFEDKWREWSAKMSRLPAGSLSDAAKEALAIEAASASQQAALEQHLRLKSPQKWEDLVAAVGAYVSTMYKSGSKPTPMDISSVTSQTVCQCCGKTGHNKADCRMKDCVCLKCEKNRPHVSCLSRRQRRQRWQRRRQSQRQVERQELQPRDVPRRDLRQGLLNFAAAGQAT